MRKLSSLMMLTLFSACTLIFGPDLEWDFRIINEYFPTVDELDSVLVTVDMQELNVDGLMIGLGPECTETSAEAQRFGEVITLTLKQEKKDVTVPNGMGLVCPVKAYGYEAQVYNLEPGSYLFNVVYQREDWNPPVNLAHSEVVQFR